MKKRITSYTFDASAKTITFGFTPQIEGFSVITNVTDNIIIYNFAKSSLGGTLTGSVLTLQYDTTSMSDTDKLMILYDDGVETQAITDGGGVITVDGAVSANTGLSQPLTDTQLRASAVPVSGTFYQATQPVSGTVSITANSSVNVSQMNGVATSMGNGVSGTGVQRVTIASDSTGQVKLAAGTNGIGKLTANSGVDIGDVDVTSLPGSGMSIFRSIDLDETEEDVKTSAGTLYGWFLYNKNAATLYLKFYNATAANTTVGTTTPIMTVPVPSGSAANVEFTNGITFGTALCVAVTTGVADNDTGAPGTSDFVANIFYK